MNLSGCLPYLGTEKFKRMVQARLDEDTGELLPALERACRRGSPDPEKEHSTTVLDADEKDPAEVVLVFAVDFTEREHSGCSDMPNREPSKAELIARIDRRTGDTTFTVGGGRNEEYY